MPNLHARRRGNHVDATHRYRPPSRPERVTRVARFRLVGRPARATVAPPPWPPGDRQPGPGSRPDHDPGHAAPAPWSSTGHPGDHTGWATRSARPARRPYRSPDDGDPPTDPFGIPAVPAPRAPWPPDPAAAREPAPHPAEAAALAGAFAVDYLSWDEDDPARRGLVLAGYLPVPGADPARLGWSGRGRQRAELALPGLVRPDGDGRVLVDVRVRVTPYRQVGGLAGPAGEQPVEPEPELAGAPAAAPAPTGRGWRSLASHWLRISVPVAIDGGRLVVDALAETPGEGRPEPVLAAPRGADPTLDNDARLTSRDDGAW